MPLSNAQLAQSIADLIEADATIKDEFQAWLAGSVGGGPNSDGRYPLTDYLGTTYLVECPAQMADDVDNEVTGAAAHKAAALAAQTAAEAAQTAAETAESNASSSETASLANKNAAETAQAAAESARTVAIAQAVIATNKASEAAASAAAALVSETNAATSETNAAASAAAAAASALLVDDTLFAKLADDEVVTGQYTFRNAGGIRVMDAGGTDYVDAYHNGSDFFISPTNTSRFRFSGGANYWFEGGGYLVIRDGGIQRINASGNAKYVELRALASTAQYNVVGLSAITFSGSGGFSAVEYDCNLLVRAGNYLEVRAADGDNAKFSHDGTDFNTDLTNTTDWNVTGITSFNVPALAATGAVTGSNLNISNWDTAYSWGDHAGLYAAAGHNHAGVYEPADATILKDADIGVNVQAYSATLDTVVSNGLSAGSSPPSGQQVIRSHTNGYLYTGWINTVSGATTTDPTRIYCSYDSFLRYMTPAAFIDFLQDEDWQWGAVMDCAYGIHGGYLDDASASFGATIWSLDTSYDGGAAGANSVSTSVYGMRWLRSSHTDAHTDVGEGLYGFINGTRYWAIGSYGALAQQYLVGDANTLLDKGTSNSFKLITNSGYVEIGPQNTGYAHFVTDRPKHYFNKPIDVAGQVLYYGKGGYLYYDSSSYASGKITVGTTAPGSPSTGDIWFDTN